MVRNSFEPQCWYLERVAHQPASGYQPTILNGPQGKIHPLLAGQPVVRLSARYP